jgi:PAS domain S-box-containing protein
VKDENKTKQQLLAELAKLRQRIVKSEKSRAERKKVEKKLWESKENYRNLIERAKDGIGIIQDELLKYVNSSLAKIGGYTVEELIGTPFKNYIITDDLPRVLDLHKQYMEGEDVPSRFELEIKNKKGDRVSVELNASTILYERRQATLLVIRDITDRLRMEKQLKASLKEKEVMMREIHHRVKNNMQIMVSLLRLQSRQIEDEKIVEMFRASQTRIRSMALIHEKLYHSGNLANIDFTHYVRILTVHLFNFYRVDMKRIRLKENMEDIFLGIHKAIPLGLIINEIISNSLKHAFPDDRKGEIYISIDLNKQGKYLINMKDNGIGFPEDFDIHNTKTLGMQLVTDLVHQIGGQVRLNRKGGANFKITFQEQ